ncbi:putative phytoene dehydrogenase [Testicularia cyperi]|uniref:Phytoene desaturase n=1 Tax=Testicularia cyperi TaxID=1882483 RepID=A0A317XLR7_9BASI|nr:putative phytoene dehydrogenase [Testicularia cyperi]
MSVASSRSSSVAGKPRKSVIIIGAGAGGTALAARLGKRGYAVTVLEKNSFGGGRCSLIHHEGHRWDQGPSLYLMPEIFEACFKDLGEDIRSHIRLHQCNPAYRIHFADGEKMMLSSNLSQMGETLNFFEKRAGNREDPLTNFLSFLKEAGENYEESIKHVLTKDWSAWWAFFRPELFPMLWKTKGLRIYTTLYDRTTKYFKSRHVRRALTFSAMYMGMSPFDAPATYSLLQYAEYAKGIWYPIGGFYKVVEAMENIAKDKFGVQFRYDTSVKRIVTDERKGTTTGVELESGELLEADVVVSNADLVWTYNNLLPPSNYAKRLRTKDQTCSSISFYWSLTSTVEELGGHNIFLADAYQESFDEIFRDGDTPSEPSFYVNVPSRLDPSAAPPGKDTLVILVPCGPISIPEKPCSDPAKGARSREQFAATKDRARRQVIETLKKRLNRPDFEDLIDHEIINDPFDWQDKFNLFRGSILGLSHTIPQVLWFRPSIQHASYSNLFFVGASTQPGTGVPVVVAGSGVVAERVSAFLEGREKGWLSWEALRGSVILAILALLALMFASFAAGFILLGVVIAASLHFLGVTDVPHLVWSKVVPE